MRLISQTGKNQRSGQRWLVVIPPEGGARHVGKQSFTALSKLLGNNNCKEFDCQKYQSFFQNQLKKPEPDLVADLCNQALVTSALDFSASHILVVALSPVTAFTSSLLKKAGIFIVHWFCEDYRICQYWKNVLPAYSLFAGIQFGLLEKECTQNNVAFTYLPSATSVTPGFNPVPLSQRKPQAAFIGIPSRNRIERLEHLYRQGFRLVIAGQGWDQYSGPLEQCQLTKSWIDQDQWMEIFASSQVGIHLPFEEKKDDRQNDQISPRIFDILACGCRLISPDLPLLSQSIGPDGYFRFGEGDEMTEAMHEALNPRQIHRSPDPVWIQTHHSYSARMMDLIEYHSEAGT